jgi:hypothetical protein
MSLTTIILMNIGVASLLVVVLAAVMLAPARLRRPFAEGHTHRQRSALRAKQRTEVVRQRGARHSRGDRRLRPIQDV